MCVCARDRESMFKCVSKWACQPCTSLAMAAFPETQLERSYGYTWLDTIVWNQRQEVERARLKLTLILQADKTAISCSLIATPHVPSLTHVIGRLPPAYGQMRCLLSSEHKGTRPYTQTHTITRRTCTEVSTLYEFQVLRAWTWIKILTCLSWVTNELHYMLFCKWE